MVELITESIHADPDGVTKLTAWATAEIETCSTVAEKYPKNYHAWTHRKWVLQLLHDLSTRDATESSERLIRSLFQVLQKEMSAIERWMKSHVTDHSAVHYLGQVLHMLMRVGVHPASWQLITEGSQRDTAEDEGVASSWRWALISDAMNVARSSNFTSYEVTWIHRRICGLACLSYIAEEERSVTKSSDAKLDAFISTEVRDLAAAHLAGDECSGTHAMSYMLWVLYHVKWSTVWKYCPIAELDGYADGIANALARNESVAGHNVARIWRILNEGSFG